VSARDFVLLYFLGCFAFLLFSFTFCSRAFIKSSLAFCEGAPPDPGVPPLPPLPIAAIPLPDGMAAPLAAFGAVPVGLFG
jgi:hypothetical protein